MTLQDMITQLDLRLLTGTADFTQIVSGGGYASDLLSCVMANAQRKAVWVTLQAHVNIVAVAALLDLSAIIITEGAMPDLETITKADEERVTLLSTDQPTFTIVGRLWELGLR